MKKRASSPVSPPAPAPAAPAAPFATPAAGGARLRVHVVPRAARSEVCGLQGDALKVRLQAPPVDGKANAALCAFVAEAAGLPRRAVAVVAGETSREKVLLVSGADPAALAEALRP
jgi:hypothetical protein